MSDGLFTAEQEDPGYCGRCGFDPCACAALGDEDAIAAADFREIEAVAAIVAATPIAEPSSEAPVPLRRMIDMDEVINAVHGPAILSFTAGRVAQLMEHGHSLAADRERPLDALVRKALDRVRAAAELLGAAPNADRLDVAEAKITIAGALLLAAFDRIAAEREALP